MVGIPDNTMPCWWFCKFDFGVPRDAALVDYLELEFKHRLAFERTLIGVDKPSYFFECPLLN